MSVILKLLSNLSYLRKIALLSQDLLDVSGLIQEDLVQNPLTGSNRFQGSLSVGPLQWTLRWPGGQRCSLVVGRAAALHHHSDRSRQWTRTTGPKDSGKDEHLRLEFGRNVFVLLSLTVLHYL